MSFGTHIFDITATGIPDIALLDIFILSHLDFYHSFHFQLPTIPDKKPKN